MPYRNNLQLRLYISIPAIRPRPKKNNDQLRSPTRLHHGETRTMQSASVGRKEKMLAQVRIRKMRRVRIARCPGLPSRLHSNRLFDLCANLPLVHRGLRLWAFVRQAQDFEENHLQGLSNVLPES